MDKALYTKEIICPVCSEKITIVKIRNSAIRTVKRDEDFCPYFEPVNVLLYNVIVCQCCGYAALDDKFEAVSDKDIKTLRTALRDKWIKRKMPLERTLELGIEAYKLALVNLKIREAKTSEFARICLRIAWLYRFMGSTKEMDFIKFSLEHYMNTYEKEGLPAENLDEVTCMYLIGELHRRIGNLNEGAKWFHKVISSKDARAGNPKTRNIVEMARNQVQTIKDAK